MPPGGLLVAEPTLKSVFAGIGSRMTILEALTTITWAAPAAAHWYRRSSESLVVLSYKVLLNMAARIASLVDQQSRAKRSGLPPPKFSRTAPAFF
jgi:hypothetical protein